MAIWWYPIYLKPCLGGRCPVSACAICVEWAVQADSSVTEMEHDRVLVCLNYCRLLCFPSIDKVVLPLYITMIALLQKGAGNTPHHHLKFWLLSYESPESPNNPQCLLLPFASFIYYHCVSCSAVVGLLKAITRNVLLSVCHILTSILISFKSIFKCTAFFDNHMENPKHTPSDFSVWVFLQTTLSHLMCSMLSYFSVVACLLHRLQLMRKQVLIWVSLPALNLFLPTEWIQNRLWIRIWK